jgi:Uma2 family endonuclease
MESFSRGHFMATATLPKFRSRTLAELVEALGGVPLERILMDPAPGTATPKDVLARPGGNKRLCELVDGVLVEKPMGYFESRLAIILAHLMERYLEDHDLGIVVGADATLGLAPRLVRLPDVSFISWKRFPNRELPRVQILREPPDLAVEILSPTNTAKEMERKRQEYFSAGTQLVWELDPADRIVRVYSSPENYVELNEEETLDGGKVLPGFKVRINDWLARASKGLSPAAPRNPQARKNGSAKKSKE